MIEMTYEIVEMERQIKAQFGYLADVRQPIAWKIPVGPSATASLFLTSQKQLLLYISGHSKLALGDIKKIVGKMSLKPYAFMPPKGRADYFEEYARLKFKALFPGKKIVDNEDLRYYLTLAPYNPALVVISEVIDGHVNRYDPDAVTNWRSTAKLVYRRLKTS